MQSNYKTGLVLSGGGARGIAHIGVLKAFEENNIIPGIIAGCSSGALIGVLWANGMQADDIFKFVEKKSFYNLFGMSLRGKGMMELKYFREALSKSIPHNTFNKLKIPFIANATNMRTGKCEYIKDGNLIDAVLASASIPMVLKPIIINDEIYVDGGVVNNFPSQPIRNKCDLLIGVNVNPNYIAEQLNGIWNIAYRSLYLHLMVTSEKGINMCDLVIETPTHTFGMFSVSKAKELYNAGYESAIKKITEIINLVETGNKLIASKKIN